MSTQDNNTPSNPGGLFSDKAFSKEANDTPISTSSPAAADANPKLTRWSKMTQALLSSLQLSQSQKQSIVLTLKKAWPITYKILTKPRSLKVSL